MFRVRVKSEADKDGEGNMPKKIIRHATSVAACSTACLAVALAAAPSAARAADAEPIRIGIISEASAIVGVAIPNAAQLAADEINAAGGIDGRKIEIISYDDHNSAADAVRAFQRAVNQDHVVAVVASYISEVVLALEPWSARLKTPLLTPGAASDEITRHIHEDYEHNKYTFHEWLASSSIAQSICDASHDLFVTGYGMKTTVVMSEDAAWTKPLDDRFLKCLPEAGLQVLDHIRFSPDSTDFTPIFNQIEGKKPDVIITGISHVGVQPTVQWAAQQVPIPLGGNSSQSTTSTFWKDTNGAADGVVSFDGAAEGVATTPKTMPFTEAYVKRYGVTPAYTGYSSYDAIYIITEAIQRAKSTEADPLVTALEATDHVGTVGRMQFYGKDDVFTHGLKYGKGLITGLTIQWQDGKQVTVWPENLATGKLRFPPFVKVKQAAAN